MTASEPRTSVLFIDDELQMRRLIHACLERNGYDVKEAATGAEGINVAIHNQPGIIILELGLTDMDEECPAFFRPQARSDWSH